ncbi:MAG: terpene cyclase/mutase family protein, partial [Planctomycetota bacterium]|nr:terpene cyclase/mutase family protein [Planctomycetota bacterium]
MKTKAETQSRDAEEYYEDDAVWENPSEDQQSRFMRVMSTSYGVSLLVHVIALFVLSLVVYFVPSPVKKVVVISKTETRLEVDPPERELDDMETPEIDREVVDEKPIVQLKEPEEISKDPRGESQDALSDVAQNNNTLSDAAGIAGGGASAFGLPSGYGQRRTSGGKPRNKIIEAGLRWLRDHQSPDGHWDAENWQSHCKKGRCEGPGHDAGSKRYNVGVTSLALLSFLGNGHTHRFGKYKNKLARAMRWLTRQQKSDGSIGFHEGEEIYNHAMATMALCEAFAMSRDFKFKKPAQRAVDFCIRAQNPGQGWKYGV